MQFISKRSFAYRCCYKPELEVAEAALKRLSFPNAFECENFLDNKAQLLGLLIEENCPVVNTPLRQLTVIFFFKSNSGWCPKTRCSICAKCW